MDANDNSCLTFKEFVSALCSDQQARMVLDEAFSTLRDMYHTLQRNSTRSPGWGGLAFSIFSALEALGVVINTPGGNTKGSCPAYFALFLST